jgi:hypothetical protein
MVVIPAKTARLAPHGFRWDDAYVVAAQLTLHRT